MTTNDRIAERLSAISLIERLANRLGFYRPSPTELIVFRTQAAAAQAGFRGSIHRKHHQIRAWWPGQRIMGLSGRPIQRVTIPRDMLDMPVGGEGKLADILRARQKVWAGTDRAMWIVL